MEESRILFNGPIWVPNCMLETIEVAYIGSAVAISRSFRAPAVSRVGVVGSMQSSVNTMILLFFRLPEGVDMPGWSG